MPSVENDSSHSHTPESTALGRLLRRVREATLTEPDGEAMAAVDELFPSGFDRIVYTMRFSALIVLSSSTTATTQSHASCDNNRNDVVAETPLHHRNDVLAGPDLHHNRNDVPAVKSYPASARNHLGPSRGGDCGCAGSAPGRGGHHPRGECRHRIGQRTVALWHQPGRHRLLHGLHVAPCRVSAPPPSIEGETGRPSTGDRGCSASPNSAPKSEATPVMWALAQETQRRFGGPIVFELRYAQDLRFQVTVG